MNPTKLIATLIAGAAMTACSSGDINISPSTVSTVNNSGGGTTPPPGSSLCGTRTVGGQLISGTEDGDGNCRYDSVFVGQKNNLTEDLLLRALPNGGAHIFDTSLFVGETYRTQAALAAAGIFEGGDGPTLTIEAGATVAFTEERYFMIINRGSQLIANGTADAPITITSLSDVNGTVGPTDVQQFGGIVINGFGVSNKCEYNWIDGAGNPDQPRYDGGDKANGQNPSLQLVGDCAIDAEGSAGDDESQYGGANDFDDSGILNYVRVKHTGATVGNGDELNGISFGAVGSGTVVNNLEVYSTFDDGVEFFGGSVNLNNLVAVYVRDDSIDIDEAYDGVITNALVIQQQDDGNHCIEADGIGSYSGFDDTNPSDVALKNAIIAGGYNSRPTISNLTCIISANLPGTHDPGAGFRFREGIWPVVNNALVIGSYAANDTTVSNDNYCLRIDDGETLDAAANNDLQLNGAIFACAEKSRGRTVPGFAAGEDVWAETLNSQFQDIADGTALDASDAADTDFILTVSGGGLKVVSQNWVDSIVNGASADMRTMPVDPEDPATGTSVPTFLGATNGEDLWIDGWTYGILPGSRAIPLWFE